MQSGNELTFGSKPSAQNAAKYNGNILSQIAMPLLVLMILMVLIQGWAVKDYHYIVAEDGLGYWLGITGGILMLLLLLYPLRKHIAALQFLGPINILFRVHMVFGLLGPTLILLHSNFQLGALNSNVALFCMLIVASSGLIGRYLYFHIHHRLTGKKLTILGLKQESAESLKQLHIDLPHFDQLNAFIHRYEEEARYLDQGVSGFILAPWHRIKFFFIYRRLWKECKRNIKRSTQDKEQQKGLMLRTKLNLKIYFYCVRRLAQLGRYQRTFSLWHVLHLPLFMLMLLTGIFHVIAVHMY